MSGKKIASRIIVALIGFIICGIGISLFLYTGLGVDAGSVMELGVANVMKTSYGTAALTVNIVILAVVFFIDKSYINISSVLAMFAIGYSADFMNIILKLLMPGGESLPVKIIMITAGVFVIGLGICTYIWADLGVAAIDIVSELVTDKLKLPYRAVRITGDIIFVSIGWILGGTVGIGTIAAALLLGPAVQFIRPQVYKLLDSIIFFRNN